MGIKSKLKAVGIMNYMTEREYNIKLEKVKAKNESKLFKAKLKAEKNKYKRKFKLPSTSKLILLGVILMCVEIVVFCQYLMVRTSDTSALYVLIGIPATLIPIIWAYFSKSKAENTAGGIVYESAIRSQGIIGGGEPMPEEDIME